MKSRSPATRAQRTMRAMDRRDDHSRAAQPQDFDPTRVLDGWQPAGAEATRPALDPAHLLDGWRADTVRPAAAPDPLRNPERLARLRQRGFEMHDVEDVEVPEIRLPAPAPPPALDTQGLAEALRSASRVAGAAAPAVPALDLAPRRSGDPRLLAQWQPGAWIGLARRAIAPSTELSQGPDGPVLESHAPGWLLALWPPQGLDRPLLSCWPQQVRLLHAEQDALGAALLAGVPEGAPLWQGALEPDWSLIAELALHHEPALRPAQLQALRDLIEAEREQQFARLNEAYVHEGGAVRQRAANK